MTERLTEEELATWGSQPTSCVEARAAAQISELLAQESSWTDGLIEIDDKLGAERKDNAGLRVELATAQEILLQERELLTADNAKLREYVQHKAGCASWNPWVKGGFLPRGICDCGLDDILKGE